MNWHSLNTCIDTPILYASGKARGVAMIDFLSRLIKLQWRHMNVNAYQMTCNLTFVQQLVQPNNKNVKALHFWSYAIAIQRWMPLTKDQ